MDVKTNAVVKDEYTIKAWEESVPLVDVLNKKEWHSYSYEFVKLPKGSYKGL
jgi:hypothetical protein